jgi:hypothetical protein
MYRNSGRANDSPTARFATTCPHHPFIPRRRASSYDQIQNTQDVMKRSDANPAAGAVAKSFAVNAPSVASSEEKKRMVALDGASALRRGA